MSLHSANRLLMCVTVPLQAQREHSYNYNLITAFSRCQLNFCFVFKMSGFFYEMKQEVFVISNLF